MGYRFRTGEDSSFRRNVSALAKIVTLKRRMLFPALPRNLQLDGRPPPASVVFLPARLSLRELHKYRPPAHLVEYPNREVANWLLIATGALARRLGDRTSAAGIGGQNARRTDR